MSRIQRRVIIGMMIVLVSGLLVIIEPLLAQEEIDVRVDRWLQVQSLSGDVRFFTSNTSRPARVGDTLSTAGDGVRTGGRSSCTLEVDVGVGTITLRENTELSVRTLAYAPDDGRITHLRVPQGSVSLNLRRFTNRGSELEIETPTGVGGVRGTEFGLIVHPDDDRTAIATREGDVFAAAQGTTVDVPAGFQTLIRLGEPPLEPIPIPDEPEFDYRIDETVRNNLRYLTLVGQVNPINQVYVEGELVDLSETGEFQYEVLARYGIRVEVRIVTPLGDVASYDISLL
jgi:hypothetical protein